MAPKDNLPPRVDADIAFERVVSPAPMPGGTAAEAAGACKLDAVHGAVLMIRKAVQNQPMAESTEK